MRDLWKILSKRQMIICYATYPSPWRALPGPVTHLPLSLIWSHISPRYYSHTFPASAALVSSLCDRAPGGEWRGPFLPLFPCFSLPLEHWPYLQTLYFHMPASALLYTPKGRVSRIYRHIAFICQHLHSSIPLKATRDIQSLFSWQHPQKTLRSAKAQFKPGIGITGQEVLIIQSLDCPC